MRTTKKPYTVEIVNGNGEIIAIEHRRSITNVTRAIAKVRSSLLTRPNGHRTARRASVTIIQRKGAVAIRNSYALTEVSV
jgi:hypothetical protein